MSFSSKGVLFSLDWCLLMGDPRSFGGRSQYFEASPNIESKFIIFHLVLHSFHAAHLIVIKALFGKIELSTIDGR